MSIIIFLVYGEIHRNKEKESGLITLICSCHVDKTSEKGSWIMVLNSIYSTQNCFYGYNFFFYLNKKIIYIYIYSVVFVSVGLCSNDFLFNYMYFCDFVSIIIWQQIIFHHQRVVPLGNSFHWLFSMFFIHSQLHVYNSIRSFVAYGRLVLQWLVC